MRLILKEVKVIFLTLKNMGDENMKIKYHFITLFSILLFTSIIPTITFAEELENNKSEPSELDLVETSEISFDQLNVNSNGLEYEEKTESDESLNDNLEGVEILNNSQFQEELEDENPNNVEDENISEAELIPDENIDENDVEIENKIEEINDEELEEGNNEENEESEEVDENTVNILSNDQPTYAPGDKGEHVRELKLKLRELGFGSFPSNPSQTYGSVTERVVKEFQEFFRLPVTGVADETTRNKIDELLNSEYRNGKKGQHVRELKLKLTQLGFGNFPSNPSTAYGNVTERVVKEFQTYYNLPKSGIVDTDTENKIEEILNPPYKNGHRGLHIVDLKKDLTRLGFGNFPSNPSIYYGNVTSRVVREFQEHFGIDPTGITDETTLEKINEILNSDYRDGVKGEHVRELKQKLTALGFGRFPSNPSQTYGSVTEKVVKEFQEYYGLPVTGIVDEKTMNKIDEVLNPPYQNGDRGVAIVELKEKLTALGFGNFPSNPSIFYGNVTSRVVKEFQQFYDLPVSGIADKATLDKIEELWESPYRNGKRGQHVKELKLKLTELGFGNFPSDPSVAYGNVTESVVKEFQSFYGLRADGIAGEETLQKIEEILANPFVEGTRADHVVQLKKYLTRLGFGNFPSNPSRTYGEVTMRVVKEFQEYYNLSNQSGNAGPETIKKMNEILNSPYQRGQKGPHVRQLKLDLRKLGFGSFPANPSQTYGEVTERVIREFQAAHDLVVNGIADEVTLAKIKEEISKRKTIKIFIDPGHGGRDSGATGNGLLEKDLVLDIAKRVVNYLNQYDGVEIKMSRTTDKYLTLSQRTKMANDWDADYFVSIHINAGGGTGFESYIYQQTEDGKIIGRPTQDEINKQNIIHDHIARNIDVKDRGKKRANFHVLRESNMSAILLEFLFIDNRNDANKLSQASYRDRLARLTAEGIAKAFNLSKK